MNKNHDGFWILLTVLTLLISLVFYDLCHNSKNTQTRVIGVSEMTLNNPFYDVINNELRKETDQRSDQLLILDPMLDEDRQAEQIEQMIEKQVDGIILNPVSSNALQKPLEHAREAGIPVVVIDCPVQYSDLIKTTIVSRNFQAGRLLAKALMDDAKSANLLILEHSQAASAKERVAGFLHELEGHPEYKVIERVECAGQLEQAMPAAAEAFEKHPEINAVMALNDPSALGAYAAADALGLMDMAIYGVDGTPEFKTKMKEDARLKATVAQSPYTMAKTAAESIYTLMDGGNLVALQPVDVRLISQDNLDEFSLEGWQ